MKAEIIHPDLSTFSWIVTNGNQIVKSKRTYNRYRECIPSLRQNWDGNIPAIWPNASKYGCCEDGELWSFDPPSGRCRYRFGAKNLGQRLEHRRVMEAYLGRPLSTNEHIHHVNGDGHDNRIENLQLMIDREHYLHHAAERRKYPDEKICGSCGAVYVAPSAKRGRSKTCSPACAKKLMWVTRRSDSMRGGAVP